MDVTKKISEFETARAAIKKHEATCADCKRLDTGVHSACAIAKPLWLAYQAAGVNGGVEFQ